MSACSAPSRGYVAAAIVAATLFALTAGGAVADDKILAASLGGRAVELLWVPEDRSWPAGGWRLERVTAAGAASVVKDRLGPGEDRQALAKLPPAEARGIASFADKLRRGTLTDQEREAADTIFVIAAIIKPDHGRALGLRYRDTRAPAGTVRYRLTALDAEGKAVRVSESEPVDASARTPLPPAPENAAVDIASEGLIVSWDEPPPVEAAPVAGYRILRLENNRPTNLTPELLLRSKQPETPRITFFDREAPHDRALAYALTSIDLFGRSSPPKRIDVPLGQLARAIAPTGLAAEAGEESAALTWSAVAHPGVRGYVVERSLFVGGPYEVVTRDGLPADTLAFTDSALRAASVYFYRVRVFDGEGNLGVPSLPVRVVPLASSAPPTPTGLKAETGKTRVELTWDESPVPVAGYFIYRRQESEREWKRLNGVVTPEQLYYDRFEAGAYGGAVLLYRVQAIGYDDRESEFSDPVRVAFAATAVPPAPRITDASGENGVARLVFEPGLPGAPGARFLVLRSEAEDTPPSPIGDPLAGDKREFVDAGVTAGATYWYELVALDAAGNRSDPSERVLVTVGAPELPVPPRPTAAYRARPFPYVALNLKSLPAKLLAVVEARSDGGKWLTVAGPVGAAGTINLTHLPAGAQAIDYRVVYLAANGARGAPSEPVTVRLR